MKTLHTFLFLLLASLCVAQQQTINVGTTANDRTGDPLRTAFQKTNANFTELYGLTRIAGTGLADNTTTLSVYLSTGNGSGQSVIGGTSSGGTLTLSSTDHATKGNIVLGSTTYDEVNNVWNRLYVTQAASTGSVSIPIQYTAGAHTSLTSAAERKFININSGAATWQWLSGTTATQRFVHFQGYTVTGASATATFTNLYSVFIDPTTVSTNAAATNNYALGLGGGLRFTAASNIRGDNNLTEWPDGSWTLKTGSAGNNRISLSSTGIWTEAQANEGASAANWHSITGFGQTNMTASTEFNVYKFDFSQSSNWAAGTLALQRWIRHQSPTVTFGSASTLTRGVYMAIGGPLKAGSNATITTSIGLEIETRDVSGGSGVGNAYALFSNAPTGATANYALGLSGDFDVTSSVDASAGDAVTINGTAGRFRKDTSGSTFTLTNSYITANSIITLTIGTTGITTGYDLAVVPGSGSATITFQTAGVAAAPSANCDVNFVVLN